LLMKLFQQQRCLLVLDNTESIINTLANYEALMLPM
jgi:hypothetical protein